MLFFNLRLVFGTAGSLGLLLIIGHLLAWVAPKVIGLTVARITLAVHT